eukprot:TRINITY_DN3166_c0_g1_i1.p1 TRINITY_DN3166_c0_g1~~TRINITY_DN3166_c0_g1_i1.p1  ORF type:complete len:350 (+),score=42.48 TRINITY_DN3166_c0_g1_i1:1269-2318(+)
MLLRAPSQPLLQPTPLEAAPQPVFLAGGGHVGASQVHPPPTFKLVPARPLVFFPRPSLPVAVVPVVIYHLPKAMNSSLGWTDDDRVHLCSAYLEVSEDPVTATGRSKDELWKAVHKRWLPLMSKKGPVRAKRNDSALGKQFKKIRKGVSPFTSHNPAVKKMHTAGNVSDDDIRSGEFARYCSLHIYEAIRTDREKDKPQGKTSKRKANVAHCRWVACWRALRTSDRFSGAANTADAGTYDADSYDDDDASGRTSSPAAARTPYQRRTNCIEAAKKRRLATASLDKQTTASTAAMNRLTVPQLERTALCLFDSLAMQNTPEEAKYRTAVLRRMLDTAGVDEAAAQAESSA